MVARRVALLVAPVVVALAIQYQVRGFVRRWAITGPVYQSAGHDHFVSLCAILVTPSRPLGVPALGQATAGALGDYRISMGVVGQLPTPDRPAAPGGWATRRRPSMTVTVTLPPSPLKGAKGSSPLLRHAGSISAAEPVGRVIVLLPEERPNLFSCLYRLLGLTLEKEYEFRKSTLVGGPRRQRQSRKWPARGRPFPGSRRVLGRCCSWQRCCPWPQPCRQRARRRRATGVCAIGGPRPLRR